MPTVCFLIPASPNVGFLSQIAAFNHAVRALPWTRWRFEILVTFGERIEPAEMAAFRAWSCHVPDATLVLTAESGENPYYYKQVDELFRIFPQDADVLVRVDADTLPVAPMEDILDFVQSQDCVAGTMAHYSFPRRQGQNTRDAWLAVSHGLIDKPLRFEHVFSLQSPDAAETDRVAPYYLNDGFIFFGQSCFAALAPEYRRLRKAVIERLSMPYYAGQVAMALAIAQVGCPAYALPLRYNLPNDALALKRYPEEFDHAVVFHYLREQGFRRNSVFASAAQYSAFLEAELPVPTARFRDAVRRILGQDYPFEPALSAPPPPSQPDIVENSVVVRQEEVLTAEVALAAQVRRTKALEPDMRLKRGLVARFGVEKGFSHYRKLTGLPDTEHLRAMTLASQADHARKVGSPFIVTAEGGRSFTIKAMVSAQGRNVCPEFTGVSRAQHVCCLNDVIVRGGSAVIETAHHALLDFQGEEPDLFDCEYDIDPSIFCGGPGRVQVLSGQGAPDLLEVDEAFFLLGPQLGAFGDFCMQYLPRYVLAQMSRALPTVPVLVNGPLAPGIREALQLVLPEGAHLIDVGWRQPVRVRRLWCASSLHYAPAREVMDARYSWAHTYASPDLISPVARELRRRAAARMTRHGGADRIFLARNPASWRKLENAPEIEAIAAGHGFLVVRTERLSFLEQAELLYNASHVLAPEGSALFLGYFARPGTRICILYQDDMAGMNYYDSIFDGCDVTVFTGTRTNLDPVFPHRSDYTIDPVTFTSFVESWKGTKSGQYGHTA